MRALALVMIVTGCGSSPQGPDDAMAPDDSFAPDSAATDSSMPDANGGDAPMDGAKQPVCLGKTAGLYCGNDMVQDGDPNTLYDCPGPNQAPTKATPCPMGCQIEAPGTNDTCKSPNTYKLPWPMGTTMQLTQDCNDSCCNDHVGVDEYAWDFADGSSFQVVASRAGTITHLKDNSMAGCGSSTCVNDANFIVIDHGDGTQSTYLHVAGGTLAQGITCGTQVAQGQALAKAGTTGWSTGVHLHFQVNKVHNGAPTCECGANGNGCAANSVPWGDFWASTTYPTVAIQFVEWPAASMCANRRITMPASQN